MGDHNRRNAGFDQMLVRIEFDRVEALAGMWDDRQGMVRIGIGISMPGKCLMTEARFVSKKP